MRPGRNLEDRAWYGYHPRAAVPALAAAVAASAALVIGRVLLAGHQPDQPAALAFYGSVLAVWPLALGRAAYRVVVRTYRLTDRAILVDWGPFFGPESPVWLSNLRAVRSGAGWLGRRLGVGWVELSETSGRVLRLTGVRDPAGFAAAIQALVTAGPAPPPP
ncbi:MAG: PH domain-containing protein [Gemmataceae bacterium]